MTIPLIAPPLSPLLLLPVLQFVKHDGNDDAMGVVVPDPRRAVKAARLKLLSASDGAVDDVPCTSVNVTIVPVPASLLLPMLFALSTIDTHAMDIPLEDGAVAARAAC